MTLLKAELSLLSTGELTLCRSLEILSTIHNNIIKHGDCFFPLCSSQAAKPYGRHKPPNTPLSNLKKDFQKIDNK